MDWEATLLESAATSTLTASLTDGNSSSDEHQDTRAISKERGRLADLAVGSRGSCEGGSACLSRGCGDCQASLRDAWVQRGWDTEG